MENNNIINKSNPPSSNRESIYEDCESVIKSNSLRNLYIFPNQQVFQQNQSISKIKKLQNQEIFNSNVQNLLNEYKTPSSYLKDTYQQIQPKISAGIIEPHLDNLIQLQSFQADSDSIWICKFSYNGRYLATGGKSSVLKIWEVLTTEESIEQYENHTINKYCNFIFDNAIRIYTEHSSDIIDIAWSNHNENLLVSVSLDHSAILWDINQKSSVKVFHHNAIVTCIDFLPFEAQSFLIEQPLNNNNNQNQIRDLFVTGCFDKIIRVWEIPIKNRIKTNDITEDEGEPNLYINVTEYITAIAFFPDGDYLALGSSDGKISVYDCHKQLRYSYSFTCRNQSGKYSSGRKITKIFFKNRTQCIITTNDSRIRLVNVIDGTIIKKFKGHLNEEGMIKADYEEIYGMIMCPSEDNYIYFWNCDVGNSLKNYCYEYIYPYNSKNEGNITCSIFVNDTWLDEYNKKIQKIVPQCFIRTIIITTSSKGNVQVLLNYEDIS